MINDFVVHLLNKNSFWEKPYRKSSINQLLVLHLCKMRWRATLLILELMLCILCRSLLGGTGHPESRLSSRSATGNRLRRYFLYTSPLPSIFTTTTVTICWKTSYWMRNFPTRYLNRVSWFMRPYPVNGSSAVLSMASLILFAVALPRRLRYLLAAFSMVTVHMDYSLNPNFLLSFALTSSQGMVSPFLAFFIAIASSKSSTIVAKYFLLSLTWVTFPEPFFKSVTPAIFAMF